MGRPADRPAVPAGLRYSSDSRPGIERVRRGRGFAYRDRDGRTVRDPEALARFRRLAIPPAWTDVWICPDPSGHIQATGRDARGRKQYRYHAGFRRRPDMAKFARLIEFGEALSAIHKRVESDLARPGLPREKVLAAVVRLLELTHIRVGNDEYARLNRSFGLTTLRARHAKTGGSRVTFRFRGKGGQQHEVGLRDRRLASIVRRCQELPGQELFQYLDEDGEPHDVASEDVNDYIRSVIGADFTAKDFRTWAGTVHAFRSFLAEEPASSASDGRRRVLAAMRETAERLGNTATVTRQAYVHPSVVEAYLNGDLHGRPARPARTTADDGVLASPRETAAIVELLRAASS